MSGRAKIIRPVTLNTTLPEDIRAKLDLHLYSELEGRVPKGAYQRFIVDRIKEFFAPKPKTFTNKELEVLKRIVNEQVSNAPQEWWVEEFNDPQDAYILAKELFL